MDIVDNSYCLASESALVWLTDSLDSMDMASALAALPQAFGC
jgi:hypothetical protein